MVDDMHDIRSKVCDREHKVLTAVSQATGRDISEIVRDVVVMWADAEVRRATTVTAVLRGCEGVAGNRGDRP